jgi:hypothetical protein
MCLGIKLLNPLPRLSQVYLLTGCNYSLAWAELRLTFAHVIRKFDMAFAEPMYVVFLYAPVSHFSVISRLTLNRQDKLPFRDIFLPYYYGPRLKVNLQSVAA